jgi:hypothetical protein
MADRKVDSSQQFASCKSPEVILIVNANDPSPCSAKRGLPQWFKGNVSSAFKSHIFYPSPPKKKSGKLAPTQLFPACVSSQKWRELHRLKTVKPPPSAVKTSTKKENKVRSDFDVFSLHLDTLLEVMNIMSISIESRIQFKLCLLMHLIHNGRYPPYISGTKQLVTKHSSHTGLHSASTAELAIFKRYRIRLILLIA